MYKYVALAFLDAAVKQFFKIFSKKSAAEMSFFFLDIFDVK